MLKWMLAFADVCFGHHQQPTTLFLNHHHHHPRHLPPPLHIRPHQWPPQPTCNPGESPTHHSPCLLNTNPDSSAASNLEDECSVPVKLRHALVWDYLREVDRFCGNLRTFTFWTFLQKLSAWKWIGVLISLLFRSCSPTSLTHTPPMRRLHISITRWIPCSHLSFFPPTTTLPIRHFPFTHPSLSEAVNVIQVSLCALLVVQDSGWYVFHCIFSPVCASQASQVLKGWRLGRVDSEDFVWYVLEHLPMTLPSHFFPQASVMPTHIHTAPTVLCWEHKGVIPRSLTASVCVSASEVSICAKLIEGSGTGMPWGEQSLYERHQCIFRLCNISVLFHLIHGYK